MKSVALVLALSILTSCREEQAATPDGRGLAEEPPPEVAAGHLMATAMLRNLIAAQAHVQATGLADENQNGVGEYCSLAELTGAAGVRGGRKLDPPALSAKHRQRRDGSFERGGYRMRVHLPGTPAESERAWSAYAWPVERGRTGLLTFFVDQEGEVLASADADYSGDKEPAADAREKDGATWKPVP